MSQNNEPPVPASPDDADSQESATAFYAENDAALAAARTLYHVLPVGEDRIEFEGNFLVGWSSGCAAVFRTTGERVWVSVPDDTMTALAQLRRVMYKPGLGTWFSLTMTVFDDGRIKTAYDYDNEPAWDTPVDSVEYVTDEHVYPIDEDNRPAWLAQRLTEGRQRLHNSDPKYYPQWLTNQIARGERPDWL